MNPLLEKIAALQDLVDIKEKYKTNIVNCLETELFPVIEEKITFKFNKETEKKLNLIKERFVEQRDLELNVTEIRQSISYNKEGQN